MAGLWGVAASDGRTLEAMGESLRHRGPDGGGVWRDAGHGLGLAHRRLAIIDLSSAGAQPMASHDGRFVLSYNGEIYNHLDLRRGLEAEGPVAWRGHSDTETLLEGFARWGVRPTLERAVGMFAIALWDREAATLTLARDRAGEKPLYYGWTGGGFAFASEVQAFRTVPGFQARIDRDVVGVYLRRNYIPAPWSIYQGVYKLQPGCVLTLTAEGAKTAPGRAPFAPFAAPGLEIARYWSMADVAEAGRRAPFADQAEAAAEVEIRVVEALRQQMIGDVPIGAFLSGGVDSSTVVALLTKVVGANVETFTIGFKDPRFDESPHARAVAQHLGVRHRELIVGVPEALDLIQRVSGIYGEPFADSSQIPTTMVSELARSRVTVALSGDGGDELFGGYNRYPASRRRWEQLRRLPGPIRQALGAAMKAAPGATEAALRLAGQDAARARYGAGKLAHSLAGVNSYADAYFSFTDEWAGVNGLVPGAARIDDSALVPPDPGMDPDSPEWAMYWDMGSYLPDDILAKVDRAAMSVSLETRVPLLDHRVIEAAWRTPSRLTPPGGASKPVLRDILYKYVPRELIERPKAGFGIPVGEWLRHELRDWAEELLSVEGLSRDGLLNPAPIRRRWEQHREGLADWTFSLWSVLMLQDWRRREGL